LITDREKRRRGAPQGRKKKDDTKGGRRNRDNVKEERTAREMSEAKRGKKICDM